MSENRPPIPEFLKRIVRQRCGFGCIFCGAPIYDYDHMNEYNKVREHQADNITLLCPNHHREKSSGRLSADIVKERDAAPRNKNKPYTAYHELFFRGPKFGFRLGGMWFEGLFDEANHDFAAVLIDEHPLLRFRLDEGHLLIDFEVYGNDGTLMLQVEGSELRHATSIWDVEFSGKELIIRNQPREIVLNIVLHPPAALEVKSATFCYNKRKIFCRPQSVLDENENGVYGGHISGMKKYGVVMGRNRNNYTPSVVSFG